jgi:hypothetical protein
LPSATISSAPQTESAIIEDDDNTPPCPVPAVHTSCPTIIHDDDDAPPIVRCPQTQAQLSTQAKSHLINIVIQDNLMPNCSFAIKPQKLHHGYAQATQALVVRTYVLGTDSTCFIGAIINEETGNTLEYCQLIKISKYWGVWTCSFVNELGQLFQGICKHKGTNTRFFIKKLDVPKGRTYMYGHIVCNYCPQKDEPHRTWLTMGGDSIDYPWEKSMPTANLTTAKLLLKSTFYTPDATFYSIDLANFYLNTPMECYEYMHLQLDILPHKIINKYRLTNVVYSDRWVYVKI